MMRTVQSQSVANFFHTVVSCSWERLVMKRGLFIYITTFVFVAGFYAVVSGHHHSQCVPDIRKLHIFYHYVKNPVAKKSAYIPDCPAAALVFLIIFFMVRTAPAPDRFVDLRQLKKRHLKERRAPPAH